MEPDMQRTPSLDVRARAIVLAALLAGLFLAAALAVAPSALARDFAGSNEGGVAGPEGTDGVAPAPAEDPYDEAVRLLQRSENSGSTPPPVTPSATPTA